MTGPTALLDRAAHELQPLLAELVFVGGATVGLLLSDPAAERPRITRDVDAATRVSGRVAFAQLEARLAQLGFGPDTSEGAPICRWTKGELVLDLLSDDARIQGFTNPWYASAIDTATTQTLPSGLVIRMVDAPHLVATKLVAWRDRGHSDWHSHDLEDIMLILDGRPELVQELLASTPAVRRYVIEELQRLLAHPDLDERLPGFLSADELSQQRAVVLKRRIEQIAHLP